MAKQIPLGDLAAAVLKETGFQKWWKSTHPFGCRCNQRQDVANYIKFKGPDWLSEWVKENIKDAAST